MTAPVFPDRVLVTGAGGPAGRSLLRQLTDRGLAVVALDMAECATAPGVPNSVMGTEPCDVDLDNVIGTRAIATSATIKVTSPTWV